MATSNGVPEGLEWRVTISGGSSVKPEPILGRVQVALVDWMAKIRSKVAEFGNKVWRIGVDDPRKFIHCLKVGLALTLVSVFYYTRPLYDGVGGTAMWSIMTVVVIFEFTVGGSLYKGFNRVIATFSAGALAIGIHWLASRSGETLEPFIRGASVFLLASSATFSRFIPTIKARFDYGITIFILTFSLVAVSGYRVDKLVELARHRLSTIGIGVIICLMVCIIVCPVWAGDDLHLLVVRNMEKLANSLEGCVDEYFRESGCSGGKESPSQKSQGYKCVLNSKASEDSLANLAGWEPSHGHFSFRHPWKQYLKVSAAMRYCSYCVEALNGCINSEIQAPEYMKQHLTDVCTRLGLESSKVLKEAMNSIKSLKRSSSIDFLVGEMNSAVDDLYCTLRTLSDEAVQPPPPPMEDAAEEKKLSISIPTSMPLMDALPLITVASLLIEISARVEGVVDTVEDLANLAGFEPADDNKPEQTKQALKDSTAMGPKEQETMKA